MKLAYDVGYSFHVVSGALHEVWYIKHNMEFGINLNVLLSLALNYFHDAQC